MTVDSQTVAQKLPREQEHLAALQAMRVLESYYRWTYRLMKRHIGRRILDAGCGVGNLTALAAGSAEYVLAADLSPENIRVMHERFAQQSHVEPIQLDLDTDFGHLRDRRFDTIVCLDVLEHVDDDIGLLRRFRQVIQPGGHLLIKVPALPWLFGSIDEASDHRRRYRRRELWDKAQFAGWQPIKTRYMNIAGVLPYWLKSRVFKKKANFSRTFKPWQLRLIRALVPALRTLDLFTGPFVGQSAILIARNSG